MSAPLKWAANDRCSVRGHVGRVDSIDGESACVVTEEGRMLFVGVIELQLPPLPDEESA